MKQDKSHAVLNPEEMDFLAELMSEKPPSNPPQSLDFEVVADQSGFLTQLGTANTLQVVARFGAHHFVFPLEISVNDLGVPYLRFATPEIYEAGQQLRYWRAEAQSVTLLSPQGEALPFEVIDLSVSGLSLSITKPDQHVPLQLEQHSLLLPDGTEIALKGKISRFVDSHTVAYQLEQGGMESGALRDYLFQIHRDQHPEISQEIIRYQAA
ncbi:PilZ domain-containing protein [Motilimonas eburnea]|uniref:PilZ domain-containing protein n=1 Tax=Motilimonas eburnea TaxID=1737488 RepID=UPI001E4C2E20|nr:PilZ domain-containing protein [Motilimonas eburnea]MCE2572439.1 PilZ domain-containing protein [Motilimonas eburnea]